MPTSSPQSRLFHAVFLDDAREASKALTAGAFVNHSEKTGATPLHQCRSLPMLRLLLGAGADPVLPDSAGRLPLETALAGGYRHVAWRLFQVGGVPRPRQARVLRLACQFPSARLVRALLALGVPPNDVDVDGQGCTPLMRLLDSPQALSAEAERVLGVLLEAGASWDATSSNGATPRQALNRLAHQAHRWPRAIQEFLLRMSGFRVGSRQARLSRYLDLAASRPPGQDPGRERFHPQPGHASGAGTTPAPKPKPEPEHQRDSRSSSGSSGFSQ